MRRQSGRPLFGVCFRIASLLVLSAITNVPASGQLGRTATIVVRVRGDSGQVPDGVRLHLETAEGEVVVADQPTHTDGQFEFRAVPKMAYRLTARAEGYQPVEQDVNIAQGANDVVVNFNLPRLAKTAKPDPSTLPSLTDAQAPKAARKEYEKAQQAIQKRRFSEARSHLQLAVNEYPCYARAQTDLGLVLSQDRKFQDSEAALRKSIECDPGFLAAYVTLGQLLNAEKRFEDSVTMLDQAVRLNPGEQRLYSEMGAAHYGLQQFEKAGRDYQRAQSLGPNPPADLHVDLANVYLKLKAYDKAYAEMRAYLQAEPNGHYATNTKRIMQQMESSGVLSASAVQTGTLPSKPRP